MDSIKNQSSNFFVFCLMMIIACSLSAILKNESTWDIMNYHYYNAYAFLNNRMDVDFFPAFANTYLNPIIELPLYFYIKFFNNSPNIVYALQGIWYGLSLFMLYKIALLFFDINESKNLISVGLILILATVEKSIWIQIGSSTNEIAMLFLSLSGIYIILRMIKFPAEQKLIKYFFSGLILGGGMGLKLTMSSTCVALGLTLIVCRKRLNIPFRHIMIFALGGLIGLLITDGWLMWHLWQKYDNPFFPYMNDIFKSEYAEPIAHRDTRNIRNFSALFPYIWLFKKRIFLSGSEPSIFFYIGFAILQITFILSLTKQKYKKRYQQDNLDFVLMLFLILYYAFWYYTYTYLRYCVTFSALLCIFVVKEISRYKKLNLWVVYGLIFASFFYKTGFYRGSEHNYGMKVIDVEHIDIPQNSVIYTYGDMTSGYALAMSGEKNFQIIAHGQKCTEEETNCGHVGEDSDFTEKGKLYEMREEMKKQNNDRHIIYIINQNHYPYFHIDEEPLDILLEENSPYKEWLASLIKMEEINKDTTDLKENYYCRRLRHKMFNWAKVRYSIYICVPNEIKELLHHQI